MWKNGIVRKPLATMTKNLRTTKTTWGIDRVWTRMTTAGQAHVWHTYPPGAALYRRILLRSGNVFGNFGRKVWTFVTIECAEHQLPLHLLTVLCSGSCGLWESVSSRWVTCTSVHRISYCVIYFDRCLHFLMLILPIYLGYFRFTFDLVLVVVLFCFYYRAPNGPCCHTGNPRKDLMDFTKVVGEI